MDTDKYNRSVTLLCPTRGGTQFLSVSSDSMESELHRRASCSRQITRDELIRENRENIDEHVNEIRMEITKDLADQLKKQLASVFKAASS